MPVEAAGVATDQVLVDAGAARDGVDAQARWPRGCEDGLCRVEGRASGTARSRTRSGPRASGGVVPALQGRKGRRAAGALGVATALALAVGTTERLAIALKRDGEVVPLFAIAGFAGLWASLVLTGFGLPGLRRARSAA